MTPLFDAIHRVKILVLSGLIGDPGVTQGHLNFLMAEQPLQDFQAHTAVKHVGGKGMPQAVKAISFIRQAGTIQSLSHCRPGSDIAEV